MGAGTAARNIGIWGHTQAQEAIGKGQGILGGALAGGLAALGRGRDDLNDNFNGAIDRLNPWTNAGTGALSTLQGSLGLGGQAERDKAVAAFQASPAYQWQVDQATDAAARRASSLGALGSGNTQTAITTLASNLADAEYGGWQDRLTGLSDRGQQAATTQAGLQGQLGQSLAGLGQTEAGLQGQFAGLGLNNLWQGTNAGLSAVQGAQKQAADNVASRNSLTTNIIGSGLGLLGMGMGGGSTLGGNMMSTFRNIGTGGLNYY